MENENIVVLDADLSTATKTEIFAKEFPEDYVTIPMKKFGLYDKDVEGHYRIFNTYQEAEDYINSIQ